MLSLALGNALFSMGGFAHRSPPPPPQKKSEDAFSYSPGWNRLPVINLRSLEV